MEFGAKCLIMWQEERIPRDEKSAPGMKKAGAGAT
jgi:hypothetical protein